MTSLFPLAIYDFYLLHHFVGYFSHFFRQQRVPHILQDLRASLLPTPPPPKEKPANERNVVLSLSFLRCKFKVYTGAILNSTDTGLVMEKR